MNGVAPEVAQEIGVLLENYDVDAGARQQKPSIMPAGPPPATQQGTCSFSGEEDVASTMDALET
ncbi:MAG TPA: hypothetical protein VN948_05405 [Terriglobales bacterium]|nr:hypothetical protein [Terriglobales bacterium]